MAALHPVMAALLAATPLPAVSPSPASSAATGIPLLPVLDAVIVIAVLVAAYVGYQRGLIQPLMTQAFFFIALFVIYRNRVDFLNGVHKYVHGNFVVAVVAAFVVAVAAGYVGSLVGQAVHRMPVARGVDGLLGVFVNAAIWLAVMYYLVSALIVLDRAFAPIANASQVGAKQVSALSATLSSNPLAAALVDPKDLKTLKAQTANGKTASLAGVSQLENLRNVYEDFVRPQVKGSRLARYVLRFGHALHLGPYSEKDLPR